MKVIGMHPSGRSVVIEKKEGIYNYETMYGGAEETALDKAKFSAKFESFTASEKGKE